jgi:hypothetical protein
MLEFVLVVVVDLLIFWSQRGIRKVSVPVSG